MELHEEFEKLICPSDLKDKLINFIRKCIKAGHNKDQDYMYYIKDGDVMVSVKDGHLYDVPIDELEPEEIYEMASFLNKTF